MPWVIRCACPNSPLSLPWLLAANGVTGWLQIIGVVGDSLNDGLDKPVAPAVYAPYTLVTAPVHAGPGSHPGRAARHAAQHPQQIASIDPDQQIADDIRDLEGWIQREPEFAARAAHFHALRRVRRSGADSGRGGPVQRCLLHRRCSARASSAFASLSERVAAMC